MFKRVLPRPSSAMLSLVWRQHSSAKVFVNKNR